MFFHLLLWRRSVPGIKIATALSVTIVIAFIFFPTANCLAQTNSSWTNPSGGDWTDANNWSTTNFPGNGQPNPGDTYNAIIDLATGNPYNVTLGSSITLEDFTLDAVDALFEHTGGVFTANGVIDLLQGAYRLNGGTISNSTLNQSGGRLEFSGSGSNVLDNTTVNGNLDLLGNSHRARLVNGSSFSGDANVTNNSRLIFEGTTGANPPVARTLDNGRTINLDNGYLGTSGNIDLTLGATMQVRGRGWLGSDLWFAGNSTILNQGNIAADQTGQTLTINADQFSNAGNLQASNGGVLSLSAPTWVNQTNGIIAANGSSTLNFEDNWDNQGVVTLDGSTLNLRGNFASSQIGTINRSNGSTINVTGNWDNTATNYVLDSATGDYVLNGGVVTGGTITQSGGQLRFGTSGNSLLDGTQLVGDLNLSGVSRRIRFANGGVFSGNANVTGSSSRLIFEGTTGSDPTATFALDNGGTVTLNNSYLGVSGNMDLTLGATMNVQGRGWIGSDLWFAGDGRISNLGTITANQSGQTLTINPDQFTNTGNVRATNGSTLSVAAPNWTNQSGGLLAAEANSVLTLGGNWSNQGNISIDNATLNLGGNFTTADIGSFNRMGNSTINVTGNWDHNGASFTLDGTTGDFVLNGGNISGGTMNQSGAELRFSSSGNNVLDGTTLMGDLNLSGVSERVRLLNNAQFTGNADVSASSRLIFEGTTGSNAASSFVLNQGGMVNLDNGLVGVSGNMDLTLGSTMNFRGRGSIGSDLWFSGDASILNQGTITADLNNQLLTINPDQFLNSGTVQSNNGGQMTISATNWTNQVGGVIQATGNSVVTFGNNWNNAGTVNLDSSMLNLGGNFETADIGTINRTGATTLNITGAWDNSGVTYELNGTTGDYVLRGGSISGGTINQLGGELRFASNGSNVLDGTTINGGLNLSGASDRIRFLNGATYNGDANVTGASARMLFEGSTGSDPIVSFTLDNGSTITLDNSFFGASGNLDLTLGPTVTIEGRGWVGSDLWFGGDGTITNQGVVNANVAGQTLNLNPDLFINEGVVETSAGGILSLTNYRQISGTTRLDGGVLRSTTTLLDIQGGSLEGTGTIDGDVMLNGLLSAGMSAGRLDFEGDLLLGASSDWLVELGGIGAGEFDFVSTTGDLTLAGTLNVSLIDSFVLGDGQEFLFGQIDGNLSGRFAGFAEGDSVGRFGSYDLILSYTGGDGNDLTLTTLFTVPEPSAMSILVLMCVTLLRSRRKLAVEKV